MGCVNSKGSVLADSGEEVNAKLSRGADPDSPEQLCRETYCEFMIVYLCV
jgi:hypothetical protein